MRAAVPDQCTSVTSGPAPDVSRETGRYTDVAHRLLARLCGTRSPWSIPRDGARCDGRIKYRSNSSWLGSGVALVKVRASPPDLRPSTDASPDVSRETLCSGRREQLARACGLRTVTSTVARNSNREPQPSTPHGDRLDSTLTRARCAVCFTCNIIGVPSCSCAQLVRGSIAVTRAASANSCSGAVCMKSNAAPGQATSVEW